ncbi:TPA: hypothetical protein DCL30_01390 [Candidatus Peribacteria bacterium]|nr:MAG: hypothetical protein A3J91_01795 [Candidatus Peribacteria bacterium RIFOXYC2_FULL_58_10]OGJ85369.1 MAG: hypothetical protein A2529_02830 [Candidatus Peribacteria bacterium RIFOXYD2_FULL_58_15]HAI98181.1 hypothetical protein [Candidatus Peribacteria bacterium]HAS34538.1 hypothetical protein [Candidatus Peribacteria bacterium]
MQREHSMAYYLWKLIRTVRNWPLYLFNRLGWIRRETLTYKLRNGMTLTSRNFSVDRCGINEVWFDHIYEPPVFDWKSCRAIIDVGANIGSFTIRAAALAPEAKILAYEAEPETAKILSRNVAENHLAPRVQAFSAAVGGKDGTAELYVTKRCSWFNSLYKPQNHEGTAVTVPVVSLATIFARNSVRECDCLKLDCEGAEYDILYALSAEDLGKIRMIVMEYHDLPQGGRFMHGALRAYLEEHGFSVVERVNCILYAMRKNG